MSFIAATTNEDGQWQSLSALDQWLWILRENFRSDKQSNRFVAPAGETGQHLTLLLSRHAEQYGDSPPTEVKRISSDIAGFLKGAYKAVFRSASLEAWEGLLAATPRELLPLTRHETRVMSSLSRFWRLLLGDDRRIRLEAVEDFVPFLLEALGGRVDKTEYIANELVHYIHLDTVTPALRDIPLLVSFVYDAPGSAAKAKEWTEGLWQRLQQTLGTGSVPRLAITLPVGVAAEYREYTKWAHETNWLLCLGSEELKEVFSSDRYAHKVQAILQDQLSLAKLNPYKWQGPIRPDMFHGREREIETILAGRARDFIVIGARQIGKSSLLSYLNDSVSKSTTRRTVFLDCSDISSPDQFAHEIAKRVAPQRAARMTIGRFSQMMRAARSTNDYPILMLVDEADRLVQMAAGTDWRLLSIMRELSSQGVCQTVMAGYKELFAAWQDRKTPLFNFASPVHLSVLSRMSAQELVEAPLAQLNVHFNPPSLVSQILKETGSHPSLLQFFCSSLINILDERKKRTVTAAELKAVRDQREYRELVLKPFAAENTEITLLERWLVLTLVREKRHEFSSHAILTQFGSTQPWLRATEISAAFAGLELSGLIRQRSSEEMPTTQDSKLEYVWTVPAFVVAMEKSQNVVSLLQELERKLINQKR